MKFSFHVFSLSRVATVAAALCAPVVLMAQSTPAPTTPAAQVKRTVAEDKEKIAADKAAIEKDKSNLKSDKAKLREDEKKERQDEARERQKRK